MSRRPPKIIGDLEMWLRREIMRDRSDGRISRLEVAHVDLVTGARADPASTFEIPDERSEDYFALLAQDAEEACEQDSGLYYGPQTYEARLYQEGAKRSCARFAIPVEGSANGDQAPSLLGTERGASIQMQGLVKSLSTQLLSHSTLIVEENKELRHKLKHMEDKHFEHVELVENLLSQRHLRKLETMKAQNKMEQAREAVKTLKQLGPAIVNRFAGENVIPGAQSPLEVAFANLMKEVNKGGATAAAGIDDLLASLNALEISDEAKQAFALVMMQEMKKAERQQKADEAREHTTNGATH